jgi:hypothetical protein
LEEALQQARPANLPAPDWLIAAECIRRYHWTEKQYWDEMSAGMVARVLFLESLYAEREAKAAKEAQSAYPRVR